MALGKLGTFLNKGVGTFVNDARKILNTDLATLAKDARHVLNTDVGELLRNTPQLETLPDANACTPADNKPKPDAATTNPLFNPDVTQKMERVPTHSVAPAEFNRELLLRTLRTAPTGSEVKVLLPYSVGNFERSHATPSGELTNDPVNAVYAGDGETVMVQLALCWDAEEAVQLVDAVIAKIESAARTAPDRTWVIGSTPLGLVYAWTRDCYFISANSPKGSSTLMRFLSAYPY